MSPSGKKLVIATLGSGTFFGEMSLVGQGMHNAFAQALEECLLCVMSQADLKRLMRNHPEVAFRFVEALGRRLTEVETHLEDMAFKHMPARLASLLLRLAAARWSAPGGCTMLAQTCACWSPDRIVTLPR